jgi:hypothetical protein
MAAAPRHVVGELTAAGAALVAVATSPPMPHWPAYLAHVRRARPGRTNPGPGALGRAVVRIARAAWPDLAGGAPSSGRLLIGLVSFTDDHRAPVPLDVLVPDLARRLLDEIARHGPASLTVPAQLELAAAIGARSPLEAALALHTATRVLARGRDTRLGLALTLEERLRCGASIAPFPERVARGGDALGDTYHYWANFAVGLHAGRRPLAPGRTALAALFAAGPYLMSAIRGRLFGSPLFSGNHARVDHLGLAHGLVVVRTTARSMVTQTGRPRRSKPA